jgi:hypothetical protein
MNKSIVTSSLDSLVRRRLNNIMQQERGKTKKKKRLSRFHAGEARKIKRVEMA